MKEGEFKYINEWIDEIGYEEFMESLNGKEINITLPEYPEEK